MAEPLLIPLLPGMAVLCCLRVTFGAEGMEVLSFAFPIPNTGDSHRSPLLANSLYSVALVEMPLGRSMLGKIESCLVMAMLNFLSSIDFWTFSFFSCAWVIRCLAADM